MSSLCHKENINTDGVYFIKVGKGCHARIARVDSTIKLHRRTKTTMTPSAFQLCQCECLKDTKICTLIQLPSVCILANEKQDF